MRDGRRLCTKLEEILYKIIVVNLYTVEKTHVRIREG